MVCSKIRRRKAEFVLDEMEQIIGYGFERINIADDLFAVDKERVLEICAGIKERGLKFPWSAFARVDTVTQEMLEAMAEAGCDSVSFGVETGNPEMLKRIKKGIKLEQVGAAVKMCKQAGIIAHAAFMVGFPGEPKETLVQTDQLARSLNILYGYHYLAPFPGTSVREKIGEYDLEILTDDWAKYDANDAIVKTSVLEPNDMRAFVASYDEEMDTDWQKILSGYEKKTITPMENMRVEGHWRMKLTYQVLKNDLIEKSGFIEPALFHGSKDNALRELCKRIIVNTNADSRIVNNTISDFANRGYLKAAISERGCDWRWA